MHRPCLATTVALSLSLLVTLPGAVRAEDGDDEAPPPPTEAVARGAAPTLADLQRATDAANAAAQAARDAVALVRGAGVSGSPQGPPPVPSFAAALAPPKAPPESQPQPVAAAVVASPATVVTPPAPTVLVRQQAPTVLVTEAPAPTVVYVREAAPAAAPAQVVYVREAAPEPPAERVVYVREAPRRLVPTSRATALVEPCCLRRAAASVGRGLTRLGEPRERTVTLAGYAGDAPAYEESLPPAPVYAARPQAKGWPVAGLPPLPSAQR